jgi:hypothetical protein
MLSFYLQSGEVHRLVVMASLPIVLLLVVFMLAVSFPDYATDLKYGKRTFLVRAGWENVVFLHNTLILLAFFGFSRDVLFEFSKGDPFSSILNLPARSVGVLADASDCCGRQAELESVDWECRGIGWFFDLHLFLFLLDPVICQNSLI